MATARRRTHDGLALLIPTLLACAGAPDTRDSPSTLGTSTSPTVTVPTTTVTSSLGAPLTGAPRLVIENHSTADIRLYAGSIVDEDGKLGTMALWPHPSECPNHEPKERLLKLRGIYDLAAPTHAFDERTCAPGAALPPGKYIVSIDSGYGSELYASAEVTLPLAEPIRLKMVQHDDPPACTPKRAQRAARLSLAAAKSAGVSPAALAGCDVLKAACGTLPLPDEEAPPSTCTVTLHENLLRIRRPPRGDPPKEITTWLDHDLVGADRAVVSRSSSAEIRLGSDRIVFEGETEHHMHEHGGNAARIGTMAVRVTNPTKRALKVSVAGVDWLSDGSCGTPQASTPSPKIDGFEPKELPPGTSTLQIQFAPRSAYQVHCDIFASRARLRVEGKEVSVISEHEVTRIEPMRQ